MSCSCFRSSILERRRGPANDLGDLTGPLPGNIKVFTYRELRSATNNFHISNKIGKGGFGTVYKGVLRNGSQVAAKALSAESRQGVHEFLTEIDVIANVRHPNLVELIGCCVEGAHRILVYEFVENNSLDRALLGPRNKTIKLDWANRSEICLGTARGLSYLHEELEPYIVHRDIKASNILLDKDFVPKIGDFGLAKLFPENITHISTRVAGTTGYLAPEYAMGGQLTKMADIYSYGVLVIEIVSGRSSSKQNWGEMQKFLLEWTWQLYEVGKLVELVDPELNEYPEDEVVRYIKVALFCTQAAATRRPTMTQVITMLTKNKRLNEKELTAPGFFSEGSGYSGSLNKKSTSNSISQTISSFPPSITQVTPR
ncbi:hypothetical protein C5167_039427 [Papaver somniferum]|uniref:Protein kinase domain-containing protein n=1 Tax=Papaver somniferum TaxID=3469 RepID=A0A4Y7IFE8_PAPSO|nr:cold-responsive protein kinase 1-like [Papaver somniferum]XP_026411131.1 cold-responsive protein kinase 1-like [Papaver somniferum]RZC46480.1 hypothetical protein C5167_039427 [Papaver somniferum]